MRRALIAMVGLSLLLPIVPASATPQPSSVEPQAAVEAQQSKPVVPGKMAPAEPLSLSVLQEEPARAGGVGQVRVILMRHSAKGSVLRQVKTKVAAPSGGRLTAVSGKGWNCKSTNGAAICRMAKLARKSPAPIYATFQTDKSWTKPSIQLTAKATWQGGPAQSSKRAQWLARASGQVSVKPPLHVKLTSASGNRVTLATHGKAAHRQFILLAHIGNIGKDDVTARWKQTGGPKVKMLQPKNIHNVRQHVGQTIRIPNSMRKNADLKFALHASGNGQTVKRTIDVRAVVQRQIGKSDGRPQLLGNLARASLVSGRSVGHKFSIDNGVILQASKWLLLPGKSTTVQVETKHKVSAVQWFIDGEPATTGPSITVSAPSIPWHSTLVAAAVTLANGAVLQESAQVTAKGLPPEQVNAPSSENITAVCKIAKDAQGAGRTTLQLAGGVTLELSNSDVTPDKEFFDKGVCTGNGAINFSKATLTHPSVNLTAVAGAITAEDGLRISGAAWKLPQKLKVPGVDSVPLAAGDNPAGARLDKGQWQLMTGELKLKPIDALVAKIDALPLIPLPGGAKFAEGQSLVTFLNATPEDPKLKDGTVQLSEKVVGPDDMSIQLRAATSDNSWDFLSVMASNIGLGQTARGDTLMASGTGTLMLGQSGSSIDLEIDCMHDGQMVADCEVLNGFVIKDFRVVLSQKTFGLLGDAGIRYGQPSQLFEFALVGAYTSVREWTLAAKSTTPWDLGKGMQFTDLAGDIGVEPDSAGKGQLRASFTGTLAGLTIADNVKVKQISPTITNECPQDDKDCRSGEIRLAISAAVVATLPLGKQVPLNAGTVLNLKTMEFSIDFGFEDVAIGPPDLKITRSRFTLSNAPAGNCTPHGSAAPSSADNVLYVGFSAEATLFSGVVTVGGDFDATGYCLWGRPGAMDLGNDMKARSGVLSFTDFPNGADLRLPNEPTQLVGANKIRVNGEFDLPQAIDTTFGIPAGGLRYEATFDFEQQGTQFALTYTPASQVVIYRGSGAALSLTQIGFSVSYSRVNPNVKLALVSKGNLHVDGGGGMAASDTPLGLSIDFGFGKEIHAALQAGVDTGGKPLENAFGQPGLIVRQLSVSAGFYIPGTPTLALNSDVTLPDSWVSNIGIKNSAPVKLAFSLNAADPCLMISIGEQESAKRKLAVDIANKGFLTAQYFRLVIAPKGCTIPVGGNDTERIDPGYGFDFDGAIMGVPITVVIDASFTNGLKIKGNLNVPSLDFYVVKLQGSQPGTGISIDMDIDSSASRYKVAFDAGIEFGLPDKGIGARVVVKGNLNPDNPDYLQLALSGQAVAKFGLIGVDIKPLNLNVRISKTGGANYADASVGLRVNTLGFILEAGGSLTYDQGRLEKLRVYAKHGLDIKIASVIGTAEFDYCLGTLSELDQNGSSCTLFSNIKDATPAYRVGFYGSFKFLWWYKPYTWTVFDQKGANGTPPPQPSLDPQTVPGGIPSLIPHTASPVELRNQGNDLKWNYARGTYLKTMYAADIGAVKACPRADLGSQWTPTQGDPNPDAKNVNPYDSDKTCGLVVDVLVDPASGGGGVTQRTQVICAPNACTAVDKQFANQVLALDGPNGSKRQEGRDALIAGLRTPLGVLPAGSFIAPPPTQPTPQLESPDYKFRLYPGSNYFGLLNIWPSAGEPTMPWISNDQTGGKATQWRLGMDGKLQGLNAAGDVLWGVGTAAGGDTSKNRVYLFVQDGMQVVQEQATGAPKPVWGVTSMGKCFPDGAKCDGKPGN